MKRERLAAIDVGTTKVCTIMAETQDKQGLRVEGIGVVPSHGLHKGLVVNINEAKESIKQSIRLAEQMAGRRLESAYIGITGRHITSANNTGTVAITRNNQVVHAEDLKRVLHVARTFKVPSEQKVLHIIPRKYTVDGQEGVMNPVGLHGFRLDVETHVITAAQTSIQNLTKCIRGIGVEVDEFIMEPLASGEAVLSPEEKQDGVLLADIGGGTTDLALFRDSTIYHTSVIPVAGYQVTRDISIGLGIPYEMAEEMKKRYGDVTPATGTPEEEDRSLTDNGHRISYRDLSEIINIRIDELIRLIMLELPQADYQKLIPAGLVITGGGANLRGIAELGEKISRMPVRIGVPGALPGISDPLTDPAYATGVGLLLWKMRNRATEDPAAKERGLRRMLAHMIRLFK